MASKDVSGVRLSKSRLVDRLVYNVITPWGVVPLSTIISLGAPLSLIEYGGEAHYLDRIEPLDGGRQKYVTACGGELPERPSPTDEPICEECEKALQRLGYETD